MTQGIWGLYKARVLQTLGGARADGALQEEVMGGLEWGHGRAQPAVLPLLSRVGFVAGRALRADGGSGAPRGDGGGTGPCVPAGTEGEGCSCAVPLGPGGPVSPIEPH